MYDSSFAVSEIISSTDLFCLIETIAVLSLGHSGNQTDRFAAIYGDCFVCVPINFLLCIDLFALSHSSREAECFAGRGTGHIRAIICFVDQ